MKPKLLTTIQDYSGKLFVADALAGVTVAMVALPLSIAIAIASGAAPAAGLVTAIIGGFLISALGGSRVQIGGPTGAFIVVVYGVIEQFGFDGLLLATLMAGVILVIAALAGAGRLIALIPEAVIEGFTIGIALIIAVSQFKDLLGLASGTGGVFRFGCLRCLLRFWRFRRVWRFLVSFRLPHRVRRDAQRGWSVSTIPTVALPQDR